MLSGYVPKKEKNICCQDLFKQPGISKLVSLTSCCIIHVVYKTKLVFSIDIS
jgi:hypothetical protein